MEFQENQYRSMIPSQNETSNSSSSSSNGSSINGFHHPSAAAAAPPAKPMARTTEPNNPYPTTFVQADTASFKQVVQMLTGSNQTGQTKPDPVKNTIPVIKTGQKKNPSSKLYERRNSMRNFKINPLPPGFSHGSMFSPRNPITPEILSPSLLNFPSLVLSPVTPLLSDPFNRSVEKTEEDKAIADKEFYFHPSPANTPREVEPRLLTLFPLTSPRS